MSPQLAHSRMGGGEKSSRKTPNLPHPRRPPAHKSVSLLHAPSVASVPLPRKPAEATSSPNTMPKSDKANPPSSLSSHPTSAHKQSSGESSDAGKWFESSNNNVTQGRSTSFDDNDPPFFLRNSSSSSEQVDKQGIERPTLGSKTLPHRPGLLAQLKADDSSTEDFRSVIDDLTIANKKLKKKLKKYEKMYDAHLQDEKLFEVRIHGLSAKKKRELEETLRKFATGIDETPSTESSGLRYGSFPGNLMAQNTFGSLSSTRFAESGYASLSASGQNGSTEPSAQDSNYQKMSQSAFEQKQENVHSYLHDIPVGLLPKHTVAMTEKSKKKLVVRRLEQIFAGKDPGSTVHQQPQQQQEVAQSAAQADRREWEATGQRAPLEGLREARIMPHRKETAYRYPQSDVNPNNGAQTAKPQKLVKSSSPDQRPTRPLDLDPHRAQVPADNIQYIRHLGFSPPEMDMERAALDSRHGWIYLNLLVNMAQLHTINVTTDFVKKAVSEYSSKLELSTDGRKIRWKGGKEVTGNSSGSSTETHSNVSPDSDAAYAENNKRVKTRHASTPNSRKRNQRTPGDKDLQKFIYTPLFFHKESSEEDDISATPPFISSASSPPFHMAGNSSGFESSGVRTSSSKRRKDDGPIIFYTKAKFCTDLTGDSRDASSSTVDPSNYTSLTDLPVGSSIDNEMSQVNASDNYKGPLASGSGITPEDDAMDVDDTEETTSSISNESVINFSPKAMFEDDLDGIEKNIDFEVSGLGGVQPHDNFTINVRCQQVRLDDENKTPARGTFIKRQYANKLVASLRPELRNTTPQISSKIISATHKELPISALPPASFLPHESTSGDADSDLESEISEESSEGYSSDDNPDPMTIPQALNLSPHSDVSEVSSSEEDDDDDDGVLDFLATARELDPDTIRAREREYDSVMAERLADEIPAGSSAATAGGGSGFNTPNSRVAEAIEEMAKRVSSGGQANNLTSTVGPANQAAAQQQQLSQRRGSLKRGRSEGK